MFLLFLLVLLIFVLLVPLVLVLLFLLVLVLLVLGLMCSWVIGCSILLLEIYFKLQDANKLIYPTYLYCKILRDKLRKRQIKETDTWIQSYHADFMYCHLIFALFSPSPRTKSPASSQSYSYPYDAIVHKSWQINSPMSFNISMDIDPFNCHPLMRLLGVGSGYNFPENRPGNLPLFPGFGWTGNEKVSIDSGRLRGWLARPPYTRSRPGYPMIIVALRITMYFRCFL